MNFKQRLFPALLLGTAIALFSAGSASASLLGDTVQADVNYSVDNPIGGGKVAIVYSDTVLVIHPGLEVDENLGVVQLLVDIDPLAETIDVSVEDLAGLGATGISGTTVLSDLDWLGPGGGPIAGIVSGASISSNPGGYPFSVNHTDDSISLVIDSEFDMSPLSTIDLTITYMTEHIPEPSTLMLAILSLLSLGQIKRTR